MKSPPGAACCPVSSPEMGIRPSAQALELLGALLLGLGLGLGYDLLRPPRHRLGKRGGSLLDLLFALLAGTAAFLLAMRRQEGRTGLWDLSAAMSNTMRLFKKIEKNLWKSAKKSFQTRKNGLL